MALYNALSCAAIPSMEKEPSSSRDDRLRGFSYPPDIPTGRLACIQNTAERGKVKRIDKGAKKCYKCYKFFMVRKNEKKSTNQKLNVPWTKKKRQPSWLVRFGAWKLNLGTLWPFGLIKTQIRTARYANARS